MWEVPEPGWYELDPSAPGGWRKVSAYEASAWEGDVGQAPDDRRLVRLAAMSGHAVAWSAGRGNEVLPSGQVIPPRTLTTVTFDADPLG